MGTITIQKLRDHFNNLSDAYRVPDMRFILYCPPSALVDIADEIEWGFRIGDTVNGTQIDYGYGSLKLDDYDINIVVYEATDRVSIIPNPPF